MTMSDFHTQLEKNIRSTRMTAAEKRELKARVVSYMEYHPRRETVAAQKAAAYIESQPYTLISIHNRMVQAAFGVFAVFVFIVIPAVAERAVPGDVLYPIKVSINEEVRSTLTFDATEKIEWETERLERRISEVRLLAEEGKLTEETEARAVEAVKAHAEAAQGEINKLKESDVDAATLAEVEFGSALEVQTAVLNAGQKTSSTTAEATDDISEAVKQAQATVAATKGVAIPAFDRITARLERQTTRSYELFSSLENIATEAEQAEIERRLQDIERKIESGVKLHETEKIVPDILLEALADTQKLISFMTDIDVRVSVKLDELVPMVLTDEEKQLIIAEAVEVASSTRSKYEIALAADAINENSVEKLAGGMVELEASLAALEAAQAEENTSVAFAHATEILAMNPDIEILLENATRGQLEAPMVETEVSTSTSGTASSTNDVSGTTTAAGTAAADEADVAERSTTTTEAGE